MAKSITLNKTTPTAEECRINFGDCKISDDKDSISSVSVLTKKQHDNLEAKALLNASNEGQNQAVEKSKVQASRRKGEITMRQKRKIAYESPSETSLESLQSLSPSASVKKSDAMDVDNSPTTSQIDHRSSSTVLNTVTSNNVGLHVIPQGKPTSILNLNSPAVKQPKLALTPNVTQPNPITTNNTVQSIASQLVQIPVNIGTKDAPKSITFILIPQEMIKQNTKNPVSNEANLSQQPSQGSKILPPIASLTDVTNILNLSNPLFPKKKTPITKPSQNVAKRNAKKPVPNAVNLCQEPLRMPKFPPTTTPSDIAKILNSYNLFPDKKSQSLSTVSIDANSDKIPLTDPSQTVTKPIATLVFFDLETTGLGHQIGAANVQITEISMVAMNRQEFETSATADMKNVRAINKLTMCIKPRSFISDGAAKITGLNDYKLKDHNHFDTDSAQIISMFLSRLPKPVCLIAHNGDRYDYPLLKAEFGSINVNLPPNVVLADTLVAFRSIGLPDNENSCLSKTKTGRQSFSLESIHLHFFKRKPAGSHSSEGDCMALAKICHKAKDQFLPWLDKNNHTFDSVFQMW